MRVEAGRITLYRASDARSDRAVPAAPDAGGRQVVLLDGMDRGAWIVRVDWTAGGRSYLCRTADRAAMNVLLAGLVVGVAGSAHCVAMCGPLVSAVAAHGRRAAWHHAGRGAVYVLLGIAAGFAGAAMRVAGLGRWWAFSLAAVLLLQAASRFVNIRLPGASWLADATRSSSAMIRTWTAHHPSAGAFGVGAINGLLPCGLVYAATVAAAGLGSVAAAVSFMAGFALGTTPALTAGALSLDWVRGRVPALNRLTPLLLVILAALLIARGLQTPGFPAHLH